MFVLNEVGIQGIVEYLYRKIAYYTGHVYANYQPFLTSIQYAGIPQAPQ